MGSRDTELADMMARFFTDQPLDDPPYLNPIEHFARTRARAGWLLLGRY
ncbi:hypothetical protein AB0K89_13845 [Streptomyces cinnamoneus]